jgi:RecB family exonuclease
LPTDNQQVRRLEISAPALELLELDWRVKHIAGMRDISLRSLLDERLQKYQLSPTHLTDFINLEYAGPQRFFFKTLLKFPEAPLPDAEFGNAVHETLEWLQHGTDERGTAPSVSEAIEYFRTRMATKRLTEQRIALEIERGEKALSAWMKQRAHIFKPGDIVEKSFHNENVFLGPVHMAGRVDRLEVDTTARTITVVDYKTGKPYSRWLSDAKLHRYRLQLYCYKLLIENSRSYKGFTVTTGRLEFIEPDEHGKVQTLELQFNDKELGEVEELITILWQHVHVLSFPDISKYPISLTGIKTFEQDLREGKV